MTSPYRERADNRSELAAPASKMSDRRRLLALAEEEYYLPDQPSRTSRWQHPLQRAIQVKQRGA
jgi:hypothetical protein